ncbi:rhophilin-2-A isoform X2 [Panulirus ornatus]|uniref:rhophilin-2-A isoform X2 n=1 Tax=Panulirus ornatus TaxID=150431 RepID=UPI003A8BA43B
MTSIMKICSKATKRGSDPRLQTCRGKLQNRRSKLNQEINKELMLRAGAENLYNATNNKRMKEQVALELQFVNSNLQLLKEQLAELNSSVEIYQGTGSKGSIPMIPLGLKETKEINFREPFKDFILEHYSEDPDKYDEAITEFMDLRGAMRTPERDESGVALLFEYFNQLYFIDRRFFPPDRSLGIYFEWYDSLTGTPSCQRTVAFEKACVLFNLGALYTQLGARHDRTSAAGLDAAVNNFLRAAGMFRYLHDTFTNAPSKDLSPEVLDMLIHLMLAQARECLHEKALLGHSEDMETVIELSQEAAQVAQEYSQVLKTISSASVKDYVPVSWVSLVHIKTEYYRASAHYHMAEALLTLQMEGKDLEQLNIRVQDALQYVHLPPVNNTTLDISVPTTHQERVLLGLAHCRESVLVHEEAMRQQRMCRELRKKSALSEVLRFGHEMAVHLLDLYSEEEDLLNVLDPPPIASATKFQLSLTAPDFSQHRVEDIFKLLGPVAVFSAKHQWSAPRPVSLTRTPTQGFGFSVRGDAPVVIAGVDRGSLAERAGMNEGDLVVCIGTRDVKWMPHDEVVCLIRDSGNTLGLTLVTPCDKTYYKLPKSKSLKDISPHSTTSSSSGVSSSSSNSSTSSHFGSVNSSTLSAKEKEKRNSWNPFKRSASRDKLKSDSLIDCNVILR